MFPPPPARSQYSVLIRVRARRKTARRPGMWEGRQGRLRQRSRTPSAHSPGPEVARAMQVTQTSVTRRTGVRLHPRARAAQGLEAESATPKRLATKTMRLASMAWERDTPGSTVTLRVPPKGGAVGEHWGTPSQQRKPLASGGQPSRCCLGPLCWGPPVKSSGK